MRLGMTPGHQPDAAPPTRGALTQPTNRFVATALERDP
jgi:hypothetical protein